MMARLFHRLLSRAKRRPGSDRSLAEHHRIRTDDGVELHMRRLRPAGRACARRPGSAPPVMLLHGLAANHRGFHTPKRSLARWLAERGHDVWMPELRGHGDSRLDHYDWRIDDYLAHDVPALIAAIRRLSGAERVHWVGHSMGGILLMCYGILHPDAPIGRGVTIGSALDYTVGNSGFQHLLKIRPLLEKLVAIPYGTWMQWLAPAIGRVPRAVESFNVWPPNIEASVVRSMHATFFHTIPVSLLSSLATTFEPGGLRLQSGFHFVEHADQFPFALRMLAGSRDRQVPGVAVDHTAALVGDNAEVVHHGLDHGDAAHYGHFDLLLGRRAPIETWPDIAGWLETHP